MNIDTECGLGGLKVAHAVRRTLRGYRVRLGLLRGVSWACAMGMQMSVAHAELPQICVTCANGSVTSFVGNGAATMVTAGNNMTVNQTSANASLNWQSFNITGDSSVKFVQPDSSSVALNRIYQGSAAQIFGSLTANGRVYLLNQNGIVFGNGSQVNVAGLIASSLDIGATALNVDGSTNLLNAANQGNAAFQLFGIGLDSADITLQQGARITTGDGGQVLMFAPNISNQGNITTPGGQTLLAAGTSVFLTQSGDANLRGLLVEVATDGMSEAGTVTNGADGNSGIANPTELVGQIVAERGNITLAGLAVNQLGRVSASTSVNENGSIKLQARAGGGLVIGGSRWLLNATQGGTLTLGQRSSTEVSLSNSTETSVDSNEQLKSKIELSGQYIGVLEQAQVSARSGAISVTASSNPSLVLSGSESDVSRIYVAPDAMLDVSGASDTRSMESNVISAELRADELADSPVQRTGALRSETVYVDVRTGTTLADVSGQIALVERDVAERNLVGGAITLSSQGDVILAQGSTLDVSGGSLTYQGGYINTSKLLGEDGRVYDIADADPARVYTGITNATTYSASDARWGVTRNYTSAGSSGRYEQGYVEGKDAGSVKVVTPKAVLDGRIVANTQAGRHQRQLASALATGQLYRGYAELPLAGQLILGHAASGNDTDQILGDVEFGGDVVLPTLTEFDPANDVLPQSVQSTQLRSELFGEDRITRVEVYANGVVTLPAEAALTLPSQGELTISAGEVEIAGQITAPSGSIDIGLAEQQRTVPGLLNVGAAAVLDVSGQWVNDSLLLNAASSQPEALLIDGGEVSLNATDGSLILADGSLIDVSGGAWARANGDIVAGDAGSISLGAEGDLVALGGASVALAMGAELLGFGLDSGGSLSISAPELCITGNGGCGSQRQGTLTLTPEILLSGGFSDISLQANERGLQVASDTRIELQQHNRVLSAGALSVATGAALDSISTTSLLPDYLRSGVNLTLQAQVSDRPDSTFTGVLPYTNESFSAVPGLVIDAGARIQADPGARLALQSNTTLIVNGELTAHGGAINLTLDNGLLLGESLDAQGIWLGAAAVLDVSGIVQLQPNEFGLRTGAVLDGGMINLIAQRGAVIANAGSQLDVSGSRGVLDINTGSGATANTIPAVITSDGGVISITASDAVILSGEMQAHAGTGSTTAQGGAFNLTMNANDRFGNQGQEVQPGADERRIIVTQSGSAKAIAPGSALPAAFAMQAQLAANDIADAGFSTVTLTSRTTEGKDALLNNLLSPGSIEFSGDINLRVGRQLIMDAAQIVGDADVTIHAPYVALGHSERNHQETLPVLTESGGALTVSGAFIELIGNSTITGFNAVSLDSRGDLRLRGVQQPNATTVQGSLATNADLRLVADQIYASTLSDFDITLANNPTGVMRVESTGESRDVVLSAGSHLTLTAPTIEQAGVLRAPFGTIELNAGVLTLESDSLTSTSAENAIIPFGSIQADTDWVYNLRGQTLVVGDTTAVPEQRVMLNGTAVSISHDAVIDLSGGGDLQAYEFVSGVGGTRDVLSAAEEPGRFAIVPALGLDYAPFDSQESTGSALAVGDTIHIAAGVSGLPEGDYVLLPARYALLDGAFVVEATQGYTDLQPGEVLQQLNGSTMVSGYVKVANTNYADARSSGFVVTPAAVLATQARYDTTLASEFFAEQSVINDTAAPRLAQDAGVLSIAAVSQLNIDGQLRATALNGGRGAAVDISAENLVISDASVAVAGEVVVSARDLAALGAESLLLGGSRASTDNGVAIDVASATVTIASDVELAVPELLVVATDTVRVAADANIAARGAAPVTDTYLLDGDSAMLRLAVGEQAQIQRTNETGVGGNLLLEQGAQLTAVGGSLALDASLDVKSDATWSLDSGSLSLGASRINLAESGVTAAGLTLDAGQLSNLNLQQLVLVSRSSIDLYGDVALDVSELALDAAGLRNQQAGGNASLAASDRIILSNRDDLVDTSAATSGGTLQLSANTIVITDDQQRDLAETAPVAFTISGFDDVALTAAMQVRGDVAGHLAVRGDLTIAAPLLLAAVGADTRISATGDVRIVTLDSVATAQVEDLGGSLEVSGANVSVATRMEAAAGSVAITAHGGDITLANGAVIDVAGRSRTFDGTVVAASAGKVTLSALQGDVLMQAGSVLDVSAVADGDAGQLNIAAENGAVVLGGELRGSAAEGRGGQIAIDAQSLGDFSALNTTLNNDGFDSARRLRQRGSGDLLLASSATLAAQDVTLTADQGSIVINGVLDASGAAGGEVVLSARNDVTVNGSILANAKTTGGDGGELHLRADSGAVRINSGALINLAAGGDNGADGGELNLRVTRDSANTLLDAQAGNDGVVLAGNFTGVEQTTLETYRRYTDVELGLAGGSITAAQTVADDSNVLFADTNSFISTSAAAITDALGRTADDSFRLLAGIEITSADDLILGSDWNLYNWRFGSAPGVLTLRAGGDLLFNRSLSDGFSAVTGTSATAPAFTLPATASDSWSYRLVAGADGGSADLLAVVDEVAAAVTIAAGTVPTSSTNPSTGYRMVRTGNGSIEVAASGDFVLGNQASVLYTAGVASSEGHKIVGATSASSSTPNGRAYPVDGGDIRINVGGDIQGATTTQLYTDWLWRVGQTPTATNPTVFATAWTINFARFMQNVGALGGGKVDIAAMGDINNLSVSIPSIGQQVGSVNSSNSTVNILGGGDLSLRAGHNIAGGNFFTGLGSGTVASGGSLTTSAETGLYPILGLGDGDWQVTARNVVGIEAVLNPTLVPQARSQTATPQLSIFSTYADSSAINLQAVTGDVILSNNVEGMQSQYTSIDWTLDRNNGTLGWLYAPTLAVSALTDDVLLDRSMILFPASGSVLGLYAQDGISRVNVDRAITLIQSDVDPQFLPGVENPQNGDLDDIYVAALTGASALSHASVPVHAGDNSTTSLVANGGDIDFRQYFGNSTDTSSLSVSTPVRVVAGGDIIDLPIYMQHDSTADVSSIEAGGDIIYSVARGDNGGILTNTREVAVDGPGSLLITAGGDVDLQTSTGFSSRGNLVNNSLAEDGAGISVLAGLNDQRPDYSSFERQYLVEADTYATALDVYVAQLTGIVPGSHADALAAFAALDERQKAPFLFKVLLAELRASAINAASIEPELNGDYSRGFNAMGTLFPDSDAYDGDIALYFSRIYTRDGGDVTLLTPGGGVNAGLASPPSSFGITKAADLLGIVSQRGGDIGIIMDQDLQVNESRVFAVNNSDIVVWSSNGDIDAGRGAKTAISAPDAIISYDQDGRAGVTYSAALAGSGIQTRATTADFEPGDVVLAAPRGVVNAGDAGIVAGNLTIAATAVLGADNIKVSGVAVGVPVDAGGLGASLAGVSAAASGASNSASMAVNGDSANEQQQATPMSDAALSWLEVFVVGLGEEGCRQDDLECLKRQQ